MELNATTTQIAEALLTLKGKPLSLKDYLPFELVYNTDPPKMTVCCGRQIGKSNSIGAIFVIKAILRPYFNQLYIAPLSSQASRFSTMYLDPYLGSPLVKKHFRDGSSKKNVFEKSLTTGSLMFLGYGDTELELDRIRGIAADSISVDEVQDIEYAALPVVYETSSASPFAFKRHYGTAKTENNTLTQLFRESNQLEWATKCDSCGKWSIPWTEDACLKMCANPQGPGCVYCGKLLDVSKGKWVAGRPDVQDHFGFHIPQFAIGSRTSPKKWNDILEKVNGDRRVFLNECCGLPIGSGGRILSQGEAMACCNPNRIQFESCFPMDERGIYMTVLGIDWSVTGGTLSFTVMTVQGFDYSGKSHVLYSVRLNGVDILEQVKVAVNLYRQFNCSVIGSDRGVGVVQVQLLQQELGFDKVFAINYVAGKANVRYDRAGQYYAADRTQNIDAVMIKMKMGRARFETPAWPIMANFWEDALHVYEEETLSGRKVYRKEKTDTDDWLHSIVFGHIAFSIMSGHVILEHDSRDEV